MLRYVLGNWKSNGSRDFVADFVPQLLNIEAGDVQVGCAPPSIYLEAVRPQIDGTSLWSGAQTCSSTGSGAFTGEVTASMLAEMCDFVLVGHSERRLLFGETDAVVRGKLDRVLEAGLTAVLCVGEVLEEREAGLAESIVRRQLDSALRDRDALMPDTVLIAYEPVWAIGTGVAATAGDAATMCTFIHAWAEEHLGADFAVLYGGSVNAGNAAELIAGDGVDGFLVGGASLKADDFNAIVQAARTDR